MIPLPNPIAGFEDWPDAMRQLGRRKGPDERSTRLAQALGVPGSIRAPDVTVRSTRTVNDVKLQELEWQLPYGPPTRGYLLTPVESKGNLPGVLWFHCHGGNKWLGAERLIDDGTATSAEVKNLQLELYQGRAVANDLARVGFAVLVHDSFSWGSRKFVLDPPPARVSDGLAAQRSSWREERVSPTPEMEYNAAAALHEHTIAKTAGLLGTSYAAMVAFEDLVALDVLRSRDGVDPTRTGVGGFSGGGGRALVVSALAPAVRAAVVCCMMTTFEGLFPSHVDSHSWLLATPGLSSSLDWPELITANTDCSYLVQYAHRDPLFSRAGMRDADSKLTSLAGDAPGRYTGSWHDTGHVMTSLMLAESADFLSVSLRR